MSSRSCRKRSSQSDEGATRLSRQIHRSTASGHSSQDLYLHRCAWLVYRARDDDKILALTSVSGLHELTDRSDRIDDRRSRWIGHEGGERLQNAGAVWLSR